MQKPSPPTFPPEKSIPILENLVIEAEKPRREPYDSPEREVWESKRTRAWSDGWLAKLRNDQRNAHAELAVMVSQTMPKDMTHFGQIVGVWVSSLSCIVPIANALRISLIDLATIRRSIEGQEAKAQQIYSYLTGPRFKHRVECIAEKFTELRRDLDTERKWMNKQWATRDRELSIVLEATSVMYGELQGICWAKPAGSPRWKAPCSLNSRANNGE
jgi:hypothetical protein